MKLIITMSITYFPLFINLILELYTKFLFKSDALVACYLFISCNVNLLNYFFNKEQICSSLFININIQNLAKI